MKLNLKPLTLFLLAFTGLASCADETLKKDVAPLAEAMCRFIEVENNLRNAIAVGDSMKMVRYEDEKHQMTIEITILNQEFQAKYGKQISDQEFGKKFRMEMNKAMIDCPHLSVKDRDRMEAELNQ